MKLILLPGFSQKNKEGVDALAVGLQDKFEIEKVYWNHWATNGDNFDTEQELNKLRELIKEDVYIVAKSIGTWLTMKVLAEKQNSIKKLILSGIPLTGLIKDGNTDDYRVLKGYPASQVKVFQNVNDPWGTYAEIEDFVHKINPEINVVSMPRSDHAYPYAEEFAKFLV